MEKPPIPLRASGILRSVNRIFTGKGKMRQYKDKKEASVETPA
jgi:hypothetical protein